MNFQNVTKFQLIKVRDIKFTKISEHIISKHKLNLILNITPSNQNLERTFSIAIYLFIPKYIFSTRKNVAYIVIKLLIYEIKIM